GIDVYSDPLTGKEVFVGRRGSDRKTIASTEETKATGGEVLVGRRGSNGETIASAKERRPTVEQLIRSTATRTGNLELLLVARRIEARPVGTMPLSREVVEWSRALGRQTSDVEYPSIAKGFILNGLVNQERRLRMENLNAAEVLADRVRN